MPILKDLAKSFTDAKVSWELSLRGAILAAIGMTFPDSSLEAIGGTPGILKN